MKKVAICGIGSISALGCSANEVKQAYLNPKHYLTKLTGRREYYCGKLAQASEDKLNALISSDKNLRRSDRSVQLAVYAASQAIEQAGWKKVDNEKIGVNIGSSRGATEKWEQLHKSFIQSGEVSTELLTSPLTTLGYVSSAVAGYLSLQGPVFSHSMTCSTGLLALSNAIAWMQTGFCKRFLAGGAEAPLTPFTFAQLEALGIYSVDDTDYPCRPLAVDNHRNSMVLGEGACVLALELMESIEKKGQVPLAVVKAIGYGFEKSPSLTGISPNGLALQQAMKMAVNNSEVIPDLIITHTPGTVAGDQSELNAIKAVFGNNIPAISCNKWKIGHTYAASGLFSIEMAINLLHHKEIARLPYKTTVNSLPEKINNVMINAAGFGGNASSVIIGR